MNHKVIITKRVEEELSHYARSIKELEALENKRSLTIHDHLRLSELKRICEAISTVYELVGKQQRKLIQAKYWGNGELTWDGVASRLHIGRTTAFNWRNEIVKEIAQRLGWQSIEG